MNAASSHARTDMMWKRSATPPDLTKNQRATEIHPCLHEHCSGYKAKNKPFPIWPYYDLQEERALKEVLESRVWWRTPGTKTAEFERSFAKFHGARHGIAVTNGTAALEVAMAGLGITFGDEVIVPDFTFAATASAVLFANALPVLVDVDPEHTASIRTWWKLP